MVVIRLRLEGRKNRKSYRVSVCDSKMPRDGRFIEIIGYYDPNNKAKKIEVNMEKYRDWISKGAQPSPRVVSLVKSYRRTVNQSLGLN